MATILPRGSNRQTTHNLASTGQAAGVTATPAAWPLAEPATERPSAKNTTLRQLAPAHPLQQFSRNAQKKKLETMRGIIAALINQFSADQNINNTKRLHTQLDLIINECSNIPDVSRKKVISNRILSECLHFRAITRKLIENDKGLSEKFKNLALDIYTSKANNKTNIAKKQKEFIDISEKIMQAWSIITLDVKQAIAINNNIEDGLVLSEAYYDLCKAGAVTRLTEAQVLLHSGYFESEFKNFPAAQAAAMINHNEHVLSALDPLINYLLAPGHLNASWSIKLNPVVDDFSSVCLDYAISALETTISKPSQDYDAEKIAHAKRLTQHISNLFTDLPYLLEKCCENSQSSISKKTNRLNNSPVNHPNSELICVRSPSGLHTPALVQSDGLALGLGEERLQYRKNSDGHFSAVDNTSPDDAIGLDADSDTNVDPPPPKQAQIASKSVQRAMAELSKSNVENEIAKLRSRKGRDNPDHVISSYLDKAKSWETQSHKLRRLAERLDTAALQSLGTGEEQFKASSLRDELVQQANQMSRFSQELRAPETHFSLMKAYIRPRAHHWAQLLSAGHIREISKPRKLPTDTPNEHLYEVLIRPCEDNDGSMHEPVWLHLHAKKEMLPRDFKKGQLNDFYAAHLKSTAQKNLGATWKEKQRQEGKYNVEIFRSPIDANLLSGLMNLSLNSSHD